MSECEWNASRAVPSTGEARRTVTLPDAVSVKMLEAENANLSRRLGECAPYLKDGETPAQCIARNRADIETLMGLLAAEKRRNEAQSAAPSDPPAPAAGAQE